MPAFKIALRFLLAKKQEAFISANTLLSVGSVALSVMVLLVVTGVMSGFGQSLRAKIMTMTPHIIIFDDEPLYADNNIRETALKINGVRAASPVINGSVVMKYSSKLYGINIRGVDPEQGFQVIEIEKYLKSGTIPKEGEALIGMEMAKKLNISSGDILEFTPPQAFGQNSIKLAVSGIFECGLFDIDQKDVFVPLTEARKIYGFSDESHAVALSLTDPEKAQSIKREFLELDGFDFNVRTWIDNNRPLFSALKTEKNMMFILLAMAVLIASLNIISTLVMMVLEKYKDIGILKAIGFTKAAILQIFLFEGVIIGVAGTLTGSAAGLIFLRKIDYLEGLLTRLTGYEVFPEDVYYFSKIPVLLTANDFFIIVCMALGISILAAVYPALKAASSDPVEALKHE